MKSNIFALFFGEFETFRCVNPSVKTVSQEPVLPAPLTQGSLRRYRARGFFDKLKKPLLSTKTKAVSFLRKGN